MTHPRKSRFDASNGHANPHGPDQADAWIPLVYEELRKIAKARLAKLPPGQSLQPTALVHEVYLRLFGKVDQTWDAQGPFIATAARAMRDILVEHARSKATLKRGGHHNRITIDDVCDSTKRPLDILPLHDALTRLEADAPRKGSIVNLRFFAGLTIQETATALDLSTDTVKREWHFIKHWLFAELSDEPS